MYHGDGEFSGKCQIERKDRGWSIFLESVMNGVRNLLVHVGFRFVDYVYENMQMIKITACLLHLFNSFLFWYTTRPIFKVPLSSIL